MAQDEEEEENVFTVKDFMKLSWRDKDQLFSCNREDDVETIFEFYEIGQDPHTTAEPDYIGRLGGINVQSERFYADIFRSNCGFAYAWIVPINRFEEHWPRLHRRVQKQKTFFMNKDAAVKINSNGDRLRDGEITW